MKRIIKKVGSLDHSYRERLHKQDWGIITNVLISISAKLARVQVNEVISEGITPTDVALDAIRKTWSSERKWSPEKCPNLLEHLAGSAKSIISNLKKKKEFSRTTSQAFMKDDSDIVDLIYSIPTEEVQPLDQLIEDTEAISINMEIQKILSGIPSGMKIYELISQDHKASEIAMKLKVPVSEVYNLHRTIKRRLKPYASSFAEIVHTGGTHGQQ